MNRSISSGVNSDLGIDRVTDPVAPHGQLSDDAAGLSGQGGIGETHLYYCVLDHRLDPLPDLSGDVLG